MCRISGSAGLRPSVGVNRRKKGAANTLAALKSIRAARHDGAPVHVILDNPSAHKGVDIRRWARKHRVELGLTPTYASWAKPIDAHFGQLRQFTIANSNHPNHPVPAPCTPICRGTTPTPATATSWPLNARSAPVPEARRAFAGANARSRLRPYQYTSISICKWHTSSAPFGVKTAFEICRSRGLTRSLKSVSGSGGGYPSDLTDEQWTMVEPLLPPARVEPRGGRLAAGGWRREQHPRRRIVDAIFYVVFVPGAPGDSYRRTSHHGRRCTGTSPGGTTTAPSSASTSTAGQRAQG